MGSTKTGLAVGLAIGIPVLVAIIATAYFYFKGRKREQEEDLEYNNNFIMKDINDDLEYHNMEQLQVKGANHEESSEELSSESGGHVKDPEKQSDDGKSEKTWINCDEKKKRRYTPAYKQRIKSTYFNNNSRNSSLSNLMNGNGSSTNTSPTDPSLTGASSSFHLNPSNSSIVSISNQSTSTDLNFSSYNIPQNLADQTSLSKTLQQPTPSYQPNNQQQKRADSDHYGLKNNYDVKNEFEITEEDQYVNEFTNYEESKRAFIEGLRPKQG